ncbi:MAG: ribokinase [Bacteroidetes bacterium]|nr:ribokinase [Bacteroidota bacterium]
MGKIVVVGSSNTDIVVRTPKIPSPGETVLGSDFVMVGGGKGANQAVAAARLGGTVVLVAKVGNDMFGDQAVAALNAEKIDTRFVTRDEKRPSGIALITVDPKGENSIVVAPGANAGLTRNDIELALDEIRSANAVLFQLETPIGTVRYGIEQARAARQLVILNPAPAQPLDAPLLSLISVLTPNETEAEVLTGIHVSDERSAARAAAVLHQQGVKIVIITMGAQGAYLSTSEHVQLIPSSKVDAIDTTAAGDVFSGALAVAMAEGQGIVEAVRFANAAAALSVTKLGAQSSIPRRAEVRVTY